MRTIFAKTFDRIDRQKRIVESTTLNGCREVARQALRRIEREGFASFVRPSQESGELIDHEAQPAGRARIELINGFTVGRDEFRAAPGLLEFAVKVNWGGHGEP